MPVTEPCTCGGRFSYPAPERSDPSPAPRTARGRFDSWHGGERRAGRWRTEDPDRDSAPILEWAESVLPTPGKVYGRTEVLGSWGTWLTEAWDWDWWVTLTYDPRKHRAGSATHDAVGWARSEADWSRWLAEAEAAAGIPGAYWFRGREPNPYRYGTHFHALVGGVAHTSRSAAWQRWYDRHGMARIEPYDPRRGAGWYVAKYVTKTLGDLQFSPNAGLHMKEARNDVATAGILDTWNVRGR